jgi:excisionase family DNA binding protein
VAKPSQIEIDPDNLPFSVTIEEYCALHRTGRTATYEAVKRGEIEHFRVGKSIRIPRRVALEPTRAKA